MNVILLFLSLNSAFAQTTDLNWKAIRSLEGRQTLQDGPNCYNATFIAKGWTSIIAQTSDEEMKYYLWHFCESVKDDLRPGDILVQTLDESQQTEHAAVFVGNGLIFEKPSTSSLYGRIAWAKKIGISDSDVETESTYALRKIEDSMYFKEGREDYRCKPLHEIETRLFQYLQHPEFQKILLAKKLMSKLSFVRHPKRTEEFKRLPEMINATSALVEKLSGKSDLDLFLYTNAESLLFNYFNFLDGLLRNPAETNEKTYQGRAYSRQVDRLQMAVRCLVDRIHKARPGVETNFIVRRLIPDSSYHEDLKCPSKD